MIKIVKKKTHLAVSSVNERKAIIVHMSDSLSTSQSISQNATYQRPQHNSSDIALLHLCQMLQI